MIAFLYTLIAIGLCTSAILAYKLHKAHAATEALWKATNKQMRDIVAQMRTQLTVQSVALQQARDQLRHHEARDAINAMLTQGDREREMTNQVLTSAGFAETMPVEEWRSTEPFQPTQLQPIPGIIDGRRR